MLEWCYFTEKPSCGWVERDGIGVAFRRTPTGRDAAGRSGAFFVHALVWEQGTMPAEVLARLWDAALWVTAPPAEPPAQLDPIQSIDELRLGPPAALPDAVADTVLAAFLDNVARGRRTSLAMAPEVAMPVAAMLAGALPRKFGLRSFSTWERDDSARRYEVVVGAVPTGLFEEVGPGSQPGERWRAAARLLRAHATPSPTRLPSPRSSAKARSPREFALAIACWSAPGRVRARRR